MGPTKVAPYPRPCGACSPDLSPREVQVRYHELVAGGYPGLPLLEDLWCPNRPDGQSRRGHVFGGLAGPPGCVHCGHVPSRLR